MAELRVKTFKRHKSDKQPFEYCIISETLRYKHSVHLKIR